jgi:tetratricopeptide (TPR) repeat protein
MAANNFAAACPKLEESQRLDPTSGTLINLADCYEKQGRIASAWSAFLDAAAAANRAGHAEREKAARDRASALAPRLSKIAINVAGGDKVAGIEVKRDGATVGNAQWGVPLPADQGLHKVTASAPGRRTWEMSVLVKGGADTLTVSVPELEMAGAPAAAPTLTTPATAAVNLNGNERPQASGGVPAQKVAALVVGGVGVAGVVVGSIFGLKSFSKHDQAAAVCDPECHDQGGLALKDEAKSAGNISTAAFIVGAAALAGGAALWLTAGPNTATSPAPQVGFGPGAILVKGAW